MKAILKSCDCVVQRFDMGSLSNWKKEAKKNERIMTSKSRPVNSTWFLVFKMLVLLKCTYTHAWKQAFFRFYLWSSEKLCSGSYNSQPIIMFDNRDSQRIASKYMQDVYWKQKQNPSMTAFSQNSLIFSCCYCWKLIFVISHFWLT